MFAQFLFYVILIMIALWVAWEFIIKSILQAKGIDINEGDAPTMEEIKNAHTQRLENLMKELANKRAAQEAASESVYLMREIKELEDRIAHAEKTMKEL